MIRHLTCAAILFMTAFSSNSFAQSPSGLCDYLESSRLSEHDKKFTYPERILSKSEREEIKRTRVCFKSYAYGFPGGADRFLESPSGAIKKDLDDFSKLFDLKAQGRLLKRASLNINSVAGDRLSHRIDGVKKGWEKEQALLFGHEFYVRRLLDEREYRKVLNHVEYLRTQYNMNPKPLGGWDNLQANTFLSAQALKNLIAVTEYRAKAMAVKSDKDAKVVLSDFAKDRDSLVQIFKYTNYDPTDEIRGILCGLITD